MSDINVYTNEGGRLAVITPYNEDFIAGARRLRGRWDGGTKAWTFDPRDSERVENLLHKVFGYVTNPSGEVATVRVSLNHDNAGEKTVSFAGREVCWRRYRDADVQLASNVVVVEGSFWGRGGSMKYPAVIDDDTEVVLEVRDVPVEALEVEKGIKWEKVETAGAPSVEQVLRAEREKLLTRLAEIDALLEAGD